MTHPAAAVVCGLVGAGSGLLVPVLVRRLPPVPIDDVEPVAVAAVADRRELPALAVLLCGGSSGLVGLVLGGTWPLLYLIPLVPVGVALAVVDWHTRILPSRLIYPGYLLVVVGILAAWVLDGGARGWTALVTAAVGAAAVFGFFFLIWLVHPRGMGFGDVRLSGLLGLALGYLGWRELVVGDLCRLPARCGRGRRALAGRVDGSQGLSVRAVPAGRRVGRDPRRASGDGPVHRLTSGLGPGLGQWPT